jgi:hypothetical protein
MRSAGGRDMPENASFWSRIWSRVWAFISLITVAFGAITRKRRSNREASPPF